MRIALTGGLASGKSTAVRFFRNKGAVVIDHDAISRTLTGVNGAAIDAIRMAFGVEVIDAEGALDRAAMRTLVFGNAAARLRLEAIVHPMILAAAKHADVCAGSTSVVLHDIPLLTPHSPFLLELNPDRILVIDCPAAQQIERACKRDGISSSVAAAILAAQLARRDRIAMADDLVLNSGSPTDFLADLGRLWDKLIPS
jgi:dephospho-CoA kinase